MNKRYVDADILEDLARNAGRTRGDLQDLLRNCEGRVNAVPGRGWDQGAWWDVRSTLRSELGLLENDNRALVNRAAMVREKAKESPLAQFKAWFDRLWGRASARTDACLDRLAKIAETAIISASQRAWSYVRSLQGLLAEAEGLRQKAAAWLAGLVGISGQIVLSITQRTWELLNSMQRLVAEAERLRQKAKASLDRLATIAGSTVIAAGQQAWLYFKSVQDAMAAAPTLFFPQDEWRVMTVKFSVTGPLHEFGIPASGKLEVTRTIKSRRNSDGTMTVIITEEYDVELVEKADIGVAKGGVEAGMRLTREREFTFDANDEQAALALIGLSLSGQPDIGALVGQLAGANVVRDGFTVSQTEGVEAEVNDGLFELAGIESHDARGVGGEIRTGEAGNVEGVVYVDLEGGSSGDLLGAHGEISWEATLGLVTDGDRTYSELTIELTGESGVSLVDIATAFGLDVTVGSVDAYGSMTVTIVTPTGELGDAVVNALRSGDLRAAVAQLEHGSHITVTGVQGVESHLIDAEFERTPVPTATIGGEVEASVGGEREVILYDNQAGGGGGAW